MAEEHKPKKRLGQHFLKSKPVVSKILKTVNVGADDIVVEIGGGKGALTEALFQKKPKKLIVIELDKELAEFLKERFKGIDVVWADATEFNFSNLFDGSQKLKVVGNLPYNVSTRIIRNLINHHGVLKGCVFMVQKEVADRLTSLKGKSYGYLPALVWHFFDVKKLFDVPPSAFFPRPKVFSSVIEMIPKDTKVSPEELKDFERFLKVAFSQRRKKLKNVLDSLPKEYSERRAEEVSPEEFLRLFRRTV